MPPRQSSLRLIVAILATMAFRFAAADPLGLYIGGALGQSHDRTTLRPAVSFQHDTTGWKALIGVRPIAAFGAEAEYLDFGNTGALTFVPLGQPFGGIASTHPRAAAVFAVGYLPVPLPYLDVFGKAGAALLKTDIDANGNSFGSGCVTLAGCDPAGPVHYAAHGTSTRPAYGAGLQLKLHRFALRVEYERISATTGDPDLLSLGVNWGF